MVASEAPAAVTSLEPPQHMTENHPHASAYSRLRRLSLVGSSADDQTCSAPNVGSSSNGHPVPSISVTDTPTSLHNAHLPQMSESQGQASGSRINHLLGLPTANGRRRGSMDARDPSPSRGMLNNLLNKGDREKSRFPSGGRVVGNSGRRRASVDLATATLQTTLNAARLTPDIMTLVEETPEKTSRHVQRAQSTNKNKVSKAKEFLFPAISSAGRRIRRGSAFDQGISIKPISDKNSSPRIPEDLIYEPPAVAPVRSRARALTISNGHAAKASMALAFQRKCEADRTLVPTVFRYTEPIEESKVDEKKSKPSSKSKDEKKKQKASECQEDVKVYITGTMTNWQSRQMVQQVGETDYVAILECSEGEVYYKFGICKGDDRKPKVEWVVDPSQEVVSNGDLRNPVQANIIRVQKSDREVFAALTVDSFSVKKECGEEEESDREKREDLWTQQKPRYDGKDKALKTDKGPPILPPHLLQVLLNKEEVDPRKLASRADRMMLPEPSSHVMLNHLYAQSIRDNLLVLASTARYKKKCVTIIYYKELPHES